jgi:anti-anti-sigma factor
MDELDDAESPGLIRGERDGADAPCLVRVETDADGTVLVALSGELDLGNIDAIDAAVASALADRPEHLVIDAAELTFADSSAIALWLRWAGTVSRLELRDPSPLLRRVVTRMGLSEKLGVAS